MYISCLVWCLEYSKSNYDDTILVFIVPKTILYTIKHFRQLITLFFLAALCGLQGLSSPTRD